MKFRTFMQGGMNLWYSSTLERFGQTQTDHKSRVGKNYSQKKHVSIRLSNI